MVDWSSNPPRRVTVHPHDDKARKRVIVLNLVLLAGLVVAWAVVSLPH